MRDDQEDGGHVDLRCGLPWTRPILWFGDSMQIFVRHRLSRPPSTELYELMLLNPSDPVCAPRWHSKALIGGRRGRQRTQSAATDTPAVVVFVIMSSLPSAVQWAEGGTGYLERDKQISTSSCQRRHLSHPIIALRHQQHESSISEAHRCLLRS